MKKTGNMVLRVKVSDAGTVKIEVNPEKWKNPAVWGILLSDIVDAIAECYSTKQERGHFLREVEKAAHL